MDLAGHTLRFWALRWCVLHSYWFRGSSIICLFIEAPPTPPPPFSSILRIFLLRLTLLYSLVCFPICVSFSLLDKHQQKLFCRAVFFAIFVQAGFPHSKMANRLTQICSDNTRFSWTKNLRAAKI